MPEASIHEACGRGDVNVVRSLIANDPAAVDADDEHAWRPIFHAALWRREAVVRLLIEAGADLAAHDGYVMHYAGEVPHNKAIVSLLLQYGALDAHVRPPDDLTRQFLAAVFLADVARVASLLVRHPHLATTPDGRGDHPIHHAARNGDTQVVRLLVQNGADVNAKNPRGHTVLYCAGGHGHLDTLQLLLDEGADCDAKFTHDGKTLLEWLAQYPDDPRLIPITEALHRHKGGAYSRGQSLAPGVRTFQADTTVWRFSCETKSEIPLPPAYTFSQAFNYLNPESNSFYILERNAQDYIQCGGEKEACTVEIRRFRADGTYSHYVVGHIVGDSAPTRIHMSAGDVTVEKREVLTHWEAIDLFTCFFEDRGFPEGYCLREVQL